MSKLQYEIEQENKNKSVAEVPPIDPVVWAAMIDMVAAFNDEDFGTRITPPRPPPVKPKTIEDAVDKSLEAITAAINAAATKEDQLELSCGLPLILDAATQRYSLAPTAAAVLKFTLDNANRPPPKLNLSSSLLFAKRTAAAAEAAAEALACP